MRHVVRTQDIIVWRLPDKQQVYKKDEMLGYIDGIISSFSLYARRISESSQVMLITCFSFAKCSLKIRVIFDVREIWRHIHLGNNILVAQEMHVNSPLPQLFQLFKLKMQSWRRSLSRRCFFFSISSAGQRPGQFGISSTCPTDLFILLQTVQ